MASNPMINVYLKLKPDNQVNSLIKEYNEFLAEKDIFSTYKIIPYIDQYPLHITLYMTSYPPKQTPLIIKEASSLAKKHKQLTLLTTKFIPNNRGYVMLSVTNDPQIQALSNTTLKALVNLRDKKASIPSWAAQDMGRKLIFNEYGSPSVLNYFNPHFSILTADHLSHYDSVEFCAQLQQLTSQFNSTHNTHVRIIADAIGVGIANEKGQIIQELSSFDLS